MHPQARKSKTIEQAAHDLEELLDVGGAGGLHFEPIDAFSTHDGSPDADPSPGVAACPHGKNAIIQAAR
jgi:hypothetical protein